MAERESPLQGSGLGLPGPFGRDLIQAVADNRVLRRAGAAPSGSSASAYRFPYMVYRFPAIGSAE